MKYTEEQIKKALRCCRDNEREHSSQHCEECFCSYCDLEENESDCYDVLLNRTLDLIKRQEAEIDRLNNELRLKVEYIHEQRDVIDEKKAEIARLEKENNHFADIGKLHSIIKSEAIKEFLEDLKKQSFQGCDCAIPDDVVFVEDGDNLVAEMVGESDD